MKKILYTLLYAFAFGLLVFAVDVTVNFYADYSYMTFPEFIRFFMQDSAAVRAVVLSIFSSALAALVLILIQKSKNTVQSLKSSENNLRTTLKAIGDAVIVTDSRGLIEDMNQTAEELTGCDTASSKGKHISKIYRIYDEKTRQTLKSPVEIVITQNKNRRNFSAALLISSDNTERIVEQSAVPVRDKEANIQKVILAFRDVSEEKFKQNLIIESEFRFRSIISNTSDGIHLINENGKVIEWNKGMEKITGIPRKDAIGKYQWDLEFDLLPTHRRNSEMLEAMKIRTLEALRTGKSAWLNKKIESMITTATDRAVHIEQYAYPIQRKNDFWIGNITRDISDYTAAVKRLVENEDKFRKTFHFSPDAIFITKYETDEIIEINRGFTDTFGYSPKEVLGSTVSEKRLWEYEEERKEFLKELLAKKNISNQDSSFFKKNGRFMVCSVSASIIEINGDKRILYYAQDITERKSFEEMLERKKEELEKDVLERNIELEHIIEELQNENFERNKAEEALKVSEKKYRTLINQLPVGVYRTTLDGEFLQVNPALLRLLGVDSAEDIKTMTAADFYPAYNIRAEHIEMQKQEKNTLSREIQLRRRDGSKIWVRDNGQMIYSDSGSIECIAGTIEDITEQKLAKEGLKESEKRYRTLFENLHDIFFRIDSQDKIISVSPSAYRISGFRPEELIGMKLDKLLSDPSTEKKFISKIKSTGRVNSFVAPIKRKDGKVIHLSINAILSSENERFIGGIEGIARDITVDIKFKNLITVLYKISRAVNHTEDLESLFQAIHSALKEIINVDNFRIAMLDKKSGKISYPYYTDQYDSLIPEEKLQSKDCLTSEIITKSNPLYLNHEKLAERYLKMDVIPKYPVRSYLGVPLKFKGETIGALSVISYSKNASYSLDDIALLQSVSDQIASAIIHKQAEMNINFQLQFLQNLIDTIPNPVYYKDARKRLYLGCNKAFENMTGISKEKIIGSSVFDIYPTETAARFEMYDSMLLWDKKTQIKEEKVIFHDGIERDIIFYKSCYQDNNGSTEGILGVIVDITNIRTTQEEMMKAHKQTELIYKVTPSCIFTVDQDRNITSWNRRAEQVTGFSAQEVIGKKCVLCSSEDSLGRCPLFMDNLEKPIYGKESTIKTKRGKKCIIAKNMDVVRDAKGKIIGGIESFEDITGRKKIEKALYWQAGANSNLAELSKSIMTLSDFKDILKMILDNALNLTGSKAGFIGIVNSKSGYMKVISKTENLAVPEDEDLKTYEGVWGWVLRNKKSIIINSPATDPRAYSADLWNLPMIRFAGTPAFSGNRLIGVIGVANSEDEYYEKDSDLLERLASLLSVAEQRIAAEREIRSALVKEQELNELKNGFISMVSHEYRTPLTAIILASEILSEYADKMNEENKKKQHYKIRQSVETMNKMLDGVILYNKIELNKVQFNPQYIDIEQLCMSIAQEMQIMAKQKCIIDLHIENGNILGNLDENLFRQIIINLLADAIKYSRDNSIIIFNVAIKRQEVEMTVKDQGIGIPLCDLDKIYDPFFRGSNTTNISGTGLGMSIVKNSVEIHKGKINIVSEEGLGTEIKVTLPFYQNSMILKNMLKKEMYKERIDNSLN